MRNRNLLVLAALAGLLTLAGVGAWLLLDGGNTRGAERPVVPAGREK